MRLALRLLCAATLVTAFASAANAQSYHAIMSGLNEVPVNASPATGFGDMTLDAAKMLHIHMEYSGLTSGITASHVHCCAPVGVNAGVRFGIGALPSPINVVVGPLTAADETALNSQQMYLNIHTSNFPGGEIRGQILPGPIGVDQKTWGAVKRLFTE